MKKIVAGLVLSSLVGLSGSLLFAQEATPNTPTQTTDPQMQPGNHGVDPSVQAQHLAKRLKLTSDQQTQVLNILSTQHDQVASLRSDASLSHADRRSRLQAVRADSESKIRALLNDDQKQTFDQMQQQRMEKQQNRKG